MVCAVNSVKHSETERCVEMKWFLKKTVVWNDLRNQRKQEEIQRVACEGQDRRVAIGNTTLIDLVHLSDLKLSVVISNIKSKTATACFFSFLYFTLKHCFSPVHL